jgi:cytoskeletal protein CcmA (bactofilin family)
MSQVGPTIVVKGEFRSTDDVLIEGCIEGSVFCEHGAVVVAATARVTGDIIARDITVFGYSRGQLVATDVVDVRAAAVVSGHVLSPRFILDGEATFHGRVEPQHLEAALRVARFQQRKKA